MLMLVKMGGETGEVESGQHVLLHLAATSCDYMLQKLSSQLELGTSSHVDNPHSAVKKEERAESMSISTMSVDLFTLKIYPNPCPPYHLGEVESGPHVLLHLAATSCDYMLQKLSSQLELWTSSHVDNPHSAVKKEERAESIYNYIYIYVFLLYLHLYIPVYKCLYSHVQCIHDLQCR